MKKYLVLLLMTVPLITISCGTVSLAVKKGSDLKRNSTITVIPEGPDRIGVQGKLEHMLLESGFNVVSHSAIEEKLMLQSDTTTGAMTKDSIINAQGGVQSGIIEKKSTEQSIGRVKQMRSDYSFQFSYIAYRDLFWPGFGCRSFNATLVNLHTGEVVASANFVGDRPLDGILKEIVEKLRTTVGL